MLDPTASIRFSSVLPKNAWMLLCKSSTDLIWMAWSGFGQTHLVWKQASAGIIRPGFWQDAAGPLPVSNFWTQFCLSTDDTDNTVQNQPRSDFVLADCVSFWPKWIHSRSKLVCKNHPTHFWPMLPTWSGPDQIQHVYRDWTKANKGSRESPQKLKRHFISTTEGHFHGTQCLKKEKEKRRLLTVKERAGHRGEKSMT